MVLPGIMTGQKHGSVQADLVLEEEMRVLHLEPHAAEGDHYTRFSLSIQNLKVPLHSDTLPPTRSHQLLKAIPPNPPPPGPNIFKPPHMGKPRLEKNSWPF